MVFKISHNLPALRAQFYFTLFYLFYNLNMPYLIYDRCRKPPASGLNSTRHILLNFRLAKRSAKVTKRKIDHLFKVGPPKPRKKKPRRWADNNGGGYLAAVPTHQSTSLVSLTKDDICRLRHSDKKGSHFISQIQRCLCLFAHNFQLSTSTFLCRSLLAICFCILQRIQLRISADTRQI